MKIVKVNSCVNCPYMSRDYTCNQSKNDAGFWGRDTEGFVSIPDWCPLEDAK